MKEWARNKNLVYELVVRDLKIRYSKPILGFFWAFLSPFLIVGVLYLVFSVILNSKTRDTDFFLYLATAVLPWHFFQESVSKSVTCLIDNKNLLKESNFPHYLIPVSIVLANAINFLPALLILMISSLFILKGLPIFIVLLPVILILHLTITLLLSIIFSILYVKWRDLKYALDALLLLLFYMTPVFYSLSLVKSSFSNLLYRLYTYNPFVGILSMYRIALLKGFFKMVRNYAGFCSIVAVPIIFVIAILSLEIYLYRKNKNTINDYLTY